MTHLDAGCTARSGLFVLRYRIIYNNFNEHDEQGDNLGRKKRVRQRPL